MLENITTQRFPERWCRLSAHSNLFLSDQESHGAQRCHLAIEDARLALWNKEGVKSLHNSGKCTLSNNESRNAGGASTAAYTPRNAASTRRWVGCYYLHEANLGC